MQLRSGLNPSTTRRAAAVVELAIIMPLVVFLFVMTVDYCRLFYFSQIVSTCARNGAMYSADPYAPARSLHPTIEAAAKADAQEPMRSQLTVATESGTDTHGTFTKVTVTYIFSTVTNYPGIPRNVTITRSARTRVAPIVPRT